MTAPITAYDLLAQGVSMGRREAFLEARLRCLDKAAELSETTHQLGQVEGLIAAASILRQMAGE